MWYKLDENKNVVPCSSGDASNLESLDARRVAYDVIGDAKVSTVFLCMNHGFGGTSLFFESMVFGGELDGKQERCATWAEAEEMHRRMCEKVRRTLIKPVQ